MKLHLIWAQADDTPWLIEAWDEDSIDGNYEGWDAALKKAAATHGGLNIRLTTTVVDYDKVLAAFQPIDVTLEAAK